MTYVVVTLVVLFFLNIYCSGVSHKLFYQSKESSMIEKCLLASDEISTLEVLNSSTVTGIVNQLESLKVTRLVVTDHSGAALYDSSGASVAPTFCFRRSYRRLPSASRPRRGTTSLHGRTTTALPTPARRPPSSTMAPWWAAYT